MDKLTQDPNNYELYLLGDFSQGYTPWHCVNLPTMAQVNDTIERFKRVLNQQGVSHIEYINIKRDKLSVDDIFRVAQTIDSYSESNSTGFALIVEP